MWHEKRSVQPLMVGIAQCPMYLHVSCECNGQFGFPSLSTTHKYSHLSHDNNIQGTEITLITTTIRHRRRRPRAFVAHRGHRQRRPNEGKF